MSLLQQLNINELTLNRLYLEKEKARMLYTLIAINIYSIFLCHIIANNRGASPVFWGVMGAIFGPLAIPFSLFAKPT